jgi:hypothetical protein
MMALPRGDTPLYLSQALACLLTSKDLKLAGTMDCDVSYPLDITLKLLICARFLAISANWSLFSFYLK